MLRFEAKDAENVNYIIPGSRAIYDGGEGVGTITVINKLQYDVDVYSQGVGDD